MHINPQKPEILAEDFGIVLAGDFNPKIYQPAWFAAEGLLRASEAENAKIDIIHTDVSSFSTDWLTLQVVRERFIATVKSSTYRSHLMDLVLGTFHRLTHTPVHQTGINYGASMRFKAEQDWHAFGHFLTPKSPWKGLLKNPGMRSVNIEAARPDANRGQLLVFAEPAKNINNEVVFRVNDHYERKNDDNSQGASFFIALIEENYEASFERSRKLLDGLLERFHNCHNFDDGQ